MDLSSGQLVIFTKLIALLKKITTDSGLTLLSVTEHLRRMRIQYIDNSPEEILSVVKDMLLFLDGSLKLNIEDQLLQSIFWKQHKEVMMQYYQIPIDIKTIVSPSFLRENKSMLLLESEKQFVQMVEASS